MHRPIVATLLSLLVLLGGGMARADVAPTPVRPQRTGFTLELGIGGAVTFFFDRLSSVGHSSTGEDTSEHYYKTRIFGGIAPLSFGIGGFLSENVALMFRASGTNYFRTNDPAAVLFYGPALQLWASDALMFGVGAGLGVHSKDVQQGIDALGVASSLRASYSFFRRPTQVANVGLELVPAFFPDTLDITLGTAVIVGWQFL